MITQNNQKITRATIIAALTIGLLVLSPNLLGLNAYATNKCPGQSNNHCYVVHSFLRKSTNFNGMQSTEKVLSTTIASGSWLENSNWALDPDGIHFVEWGWHQNSGGATPFFICGAGSGGGGNFQQFGSAPTDGTYYVFEGDDLAITDKIWKINIGGNTCNVASNSAYAYQLNVGYELTNSDAQTLRTNDYTGMEFAYAPSNWNLWGSANGYNGKDLEPNDSTYFVSFCGTGDQQYYHSKHGQGTPVTC